MDRDMEAMVELLGRDSPQVKALVAAASAGMGEAAREMLRSLVRQGGWDPNNLPAFCLPRDISPSDCLIGTAMSGEVAAAEVGLADPDLRGHVGIFGATGSGKSTVVRLTIFAFMNTAGQVRTCRRTFFIWDARDEYRRLLSLFPPEELVWLGVDELGVNPFEIPVARDGRPVTTAERWLGNLREWLRVFWLNEPSLNLLCEVLLEEYQRRGLLENPLGDYPCLSDVVAAVERLSPPRNSDRAKARDKLLDRLKSLRAMLPGLDVQRSRSLVRLLDYSVILDITGAKDVARPGLFSLLTMEKSEVLGLDADAPITRLEVIDEAHELLGAWTDRRTADIKESRPASLLRDLRKTGTCGIVTTHLPADLAPPVRSNLGSVIVLRQGHRNSIGECAGMLDLKPWKEGEVGRLLDRYAIARFARYGEPVYLAIKDARALFPPERPAPSREEARARSKAVLDSIPFVKRGGQPLPLEGPAPLSDERGLPPSDGGERWSRGGKSSREFFGVGPAGPGPKGAGRPTAAGAGGGAAAGNTVVAPGSAGQVAPSAAHGGLPPREFRVLARIAERPWEMITDRADALGLDRETEGDARSSLETRGLIALAGKVGAKQRLFSLSPRGREFARALSLPVAKQEKGSTVHQAIVEYAQLSLGRFSAAFRFQRAGVSPTTARVQPDLLLVCPGGSRIPIQACCHNQPGYEAAALLRLHQLTQLGLGDADKCDFVLAVAANKGHRSAVERALERENGGTLPSRVVLTDFDTVVEPGFDWSAILEFPL